MAPLFWDAHCHLDRLSPQALAATLAACESVAIERFILAGVDPKSWQAQESLCQQYPKHFRRATGIHPWIAGTLTTAQAAAYLQQLSHDITAAGILGEVGLDFAQATTSEARARQLQVCRDQLQANRAWRFPVILHVVRSHQAILQIIADYQGMAFQVHGFQGSLPLARQYVAKGCYLSLGGGILKPKHRELLSWLPLDRFMIESDTDCATAGRQPQDVCPAVAVAIAAAKGMTPSAIIEHASQNVVSWLASKAGR